MYLNFCPNFSNRDGSAGAHDSSSRLRVVRRPLGADAWQVQQAKFACIQRQQCCRECRAVVEPLSLLPACHLEVSVCAQQILLLQCPTARRHRVETRGAFCWRADRDCVGCRLGLTPFMAGILLFRKTVTWGAYVVQLLLGHSRRPQSSAARPQPHAAVWHPSGSTCRQEPSELYTINFFFD